MKLETILYASNIACARYLYAPEFDRSSSGRRYRQYLAFNDRIRWMFKELEEEIEYLVEYGNR